MAMSRLLTIILLLWVSAVGFSVVAQDGDVSAVRVSSPDSVSKVYPDATDKGIRGLSCMEDSKATSRSYFYFALGKGFIMSKVTTDWVTGHPRNGLNILFGFDRLFAKSNLGIGVMFNSFYSSGKFPYYGDIALRSSLWIYQISPQFVFSVPMRNKKIRLGLRAGVGLSVLNTRNVVQEEDYEDRDYLKNEHGVGLNLQLEFDYRIARLVSFICSATYKGDLIRRENEKYGVLDNGGGFHGIGITAGFKFRL